LGNQQATCESRESSETIRKAFEVSRGYGMINMMQESYLIRQRTRRKLTNNSATRKYEKTVNGFLMRMYRNMQSRVQGVQKKKAHLYVDLYLLPREEFYIWAKSCGKFYELFESWNLSKYERRLAPSVDRVDPTIGYELSNMEWVTHGENSRRSSITRLRFK